MPWFRKGVGGRCQCFHLVHFGSPVQALSHSCLMFQVTLHAMDFNITKFKKIEERLTVSQYLTCFIFFAKQYVRQPTHTGLWTCFALPNELTQGCSHQVVLCWWSSREGVLSAVWTQILAGIYLMGWDRWMDGRTDEHMGAQSPFAVLTGNETWGVACHSSCSVLA